MASSTEDNLNRSSGSGRSVQSRRQQASDTSDAIYDSVTRKIARMQCSK